MYKAKLTKVAAAIGRSVDRKTASGIFIGVAVMSAGLAISQSSGLAGLSNPFVNVFGGAASGASTSPLISLEYGVIAQDQLNDAINCGNPATVGGLGEAFQSAVDLHTGMAAAGPDIESLFEASGDCFSGISQIFDLSFAIPSLGSIIAAAQSAVMAYAQKKVCTAVNKVSKQVTDPINKAITKFNGLNAYTNLNGGVNTTVGNALTALDPQLGAEYHPAAPAGSVNVATTPFSTGQTGFTATTPTLNTTGATIAQLNQQIAALQVNVGPQTQALQAAQTAAAQCAATQAASTANYQAYIAALGASATITLDQYTGCNLAGLQQTQNSAQQALTATQNQINTLVAAVTKASAPSPAVTAPVASPSNSWTNAVTGLFGN